MRENRTFGTVRGAPGNGRSYRESRLPMTKLKATNSSVLGRLLEELSWVGSTIRDYRNGGRGYENVLTAEALQALDFLPRKFFFGSVLTGAHEADAARTSLISEIEEAVFTLLPGNHPLVPSGDRHQTQMSVQPDGIIETPSTYTILKAKRIRISSFQPEQIAREFALTIRDAGPRKPILLLIIGASPPIKVAKHGKLSLPEAISLYLDSVLVRAENHSFTPQHARLLINDVVCWITWHEIAEIVKWQRDLFQTADESMQGCINRLSASVTDAISWHGYDNG